MKLLSWDGDGLCLFAKRLERGRIADCLRCDFLPECHMASTAIRDRLRTDWHLTGIAGGSMSLDPTDAPLVLRDTGSEDIYEITLEEK